MSLKRGILQYTFIRPLLSIIIIILKLANVYHEGTIVHFSSGYFGYDSAYLYISIIMNSSVTIAMYYLVLFFMALKKDLKGNFPILKFSSIKLVVFLTFWQDFFVSLAVFLGLIKSDNILIE